MKKVITIIITLVVSLLASCELVENFDGLSGKATLDLPISYDMSSISKTLKTEYGIDVSSVTATVKNELFTYGPVVLSFDPSTDVATGTIEDIVEGRYTVTLQAYIVDGENESMLVAEGSKKGVVITDGETTNVNITMRIVAGFGDLVISGTIEEIPRDGLVVEYLFDGNPNDTSGNDHHATVFGTEYVEDRSGNASSAISLDGVNDVVSISDFTATSTDQLTIAFWVKHNLTSADYMVFIDKHFEYNVVHHNDSDGRHLTFSLDSIGALSIDITPEAGIWNHITAVYDGEFMYLYLNGTEIGRQESTGYVKDNSYKCFIGSDETAIYHYLAGEMDNIRIYNRALSNSEIRILYNE